MPYLKPNSKEEVTNPASLSDQPEKDLVSKGQAGLDSSEAKSTDTPARPPVISAEEKILDEETGVASSTKFASLNDLEDSTAGPAAAITTVTPSTQSTVLVKRQDSKGTQESVDSGYASTASTMERPIPSGT